MSQVYLFNYKFNRPQKQYKCLQIINPHKKNKLLKKMIIKIALLLLQRRKFHKFLSIFYFKTNKS